MTNLQLLTEEDLQKLGWGSRWTIYRQRRAGTFPEPDLTHPNRWTPETMERHARHVAASNRRAKQDLQSGQQGLLPNEPRR